MKRQIYLAGFTLVELLIVVGIISVVAVAVILILNPVEILRQTRDSRRISELNSLTRALAVFEAAQPGGHMGTSSVVYMSIPDTASNCSNLDLPELPDGWTYKCSSNSDLNGIDGNGWLPIDFVAMPQGSPLASLPVDPINSASSGLYYAYVTEGSYELLAKMESSKYKSGGDRDIVTRDGGSSDSVYEVGKGLFLTPTVVEEFGVVDLTLAGHWSFDDNMGTVAEDSSVAGNNGNLVNMESGDWVAGLSGSALDFDGSNEYVGLGDVLDFERTDPFTVSAWIYHHTQAGADAIIGKENHGSPYQGWNLDLNGSFPRFALIASYSADAILITCNSSVPLNSWTHIAVTYDGSSNASGVKFYIDGDVKSATANNNSLDSGTTVTSFPLNIGGRNNTTGSNFDGVIDDVRVYNRVLEPEEIEALYQALQ